MIDWIRSRRRDFRARVPVGPSRRDGRENARCCPGDKADERLDGWLGELILCVHHELSPSALNVEVDPKLVLEYGEVHFGYDPGEIGVGPFAVITLVHLGTSYSIVRGVLLSSTSPASARDAIAQ